MIGNINISWFTSNWQWVLIGYFIVSGVVVLISNYFFGQDNTYKYVTRTIGIGWIIAVTIIEFAVRVISWPWRFRKTRLLKEVFEITSVEAENFVYNQHLVDTELAHRAREMMLWCQKQEFARKSNDQPELEFTTRQVKHCKKSFWNAHKLAARNGFLVNDTIGEYA